MITELKTTILVLGLVACCTFPAQARSKHNSVSAPMDPKMPKAALVTTSDNPSKMSVAGTQVEFFSPSTVRILKGEKSPSFSIVKTPERVAVSCFSDSLGNRCIASAKLLVAVSPETGLVTVLRSDGTVLVREKSTSGASGTFILDENEAIYGLGQHKFQGMNQRGKSYYLQNNNTEIGIPLVHSSKGYALYWDNYSSTSFSDGPEGMTFSSDDGDCADYYVIAGSGADEVVAGIRDLSGAAPLSPLWSYGFHQSRERYLSQEELVSTVRKYRELGVPLDGIVQDWRYWGEDHKDWNAVEFRNPNFPDPKGMMDEIHSLNAHCLISIWPSFGRETAIRADMEAENLLLPIETFPQENDVKVYDPFSPRARNIYWSYIDRNLFSAGLDGWWLDATEPEHGPVREGDFDAMTAEGSFRKMRNAFPLYSVGGVYDHQRAKTSDKRVFNLTRSATLGIQRYGAHVWSGDLASGWPELHYQVAEALNFSLCGIPYWNSDIGGFFAAYNYPDGYRNPEFRRLYLRWMEYSVFCGMMRSHGTHTPREIFVFGGPGDLDFEAQRECIRLRYLLLPYIYAAASDIAFKGGSLQRALFMDWPSDSQVLDIDDEFMFARNILVAPVTEDTTAREVYLPEGKWTDFWTGESLEGSSDFVREAPLGLIPLYVRAGSVLPMGPDVQYAAEKPWDNLQIRIYPGADGEFTLYEDEGDGYAYEKGSRSEIRFVWDDSERTLTIAEREGSFPGMLSEREFRVVLVAPGHATGTDNISFDRAVRYDGSAVTVRLD